MKIKKEQMIFDFAILLFILFYIVITMSYSPTARAVPLFISIPTTIMIASLIVKDLTDIRKLNSASSENDNYNINQKQKSANSLKVIIFWMTITAFLVYIVGFLVAVPILIIFFLRLHAKGSWFFCISSAIGLELVMYIGFMSLLNVYLYKGIIWLSIFGR